MARKNTTKNTTAPSFVSMGKGTGGSLYKETHCGTFLGISDRDSEGNPRGVWEAFDRETGEVSVVPNTWTAFFADGARVNFPTHFASQEEIDDPDVYVQVVVHKKVTYHIAAWRGYHERIDLDACATSGEPVAIFRKANGYRDIATPSTHPGMFADGVFVGEQADLDEGDGIAE